MNSFDLMTHDWSAFFGAMAQISGSLVGLVFVALTFNRQLLGDGKDPILGILARQTFADFIVLLLVSLAMLAPHMAAEDVGAFILVVAILDVLHVSVGLWKQRAQLFRRASGWTLPQRFILSIVGRAMLGWVGIELVRGDGVPARIDMMLFVGVLMLLLSGCRSAWLLLTHEEK